MSKLSHTKIAIQVASASITKLKWNLIDAIKYFLKKKKKGWIELSCSVTINMVNSNNLEEITQIHTDGRIELSNSYGRVTKDNTLNDLNVSQLFDLLIQLDENDVQVDEIG